MTLKPRILGSMEEISAAAWDGLANPDPVTFNPFVSHAFLSALEASGSATRKSGWMASHLLLEDDGRLVAAAPCYLKSHSMGEYVFDQGWADAFERAGGHYYPKLQVAVPFSPVTAPKLLAPTAVLRDALAAALVQLCAAQQASSVHVTFALENDAAALSGKEWLLRNDIQFHWFNEGYENFDAFLAALSSSKRKNLRKERQAVHDAGITFEALTGDAIQPQHWDYFWEFYMDTGSRKWGQPYLTRKFFKLIHASMRQHVLLIMAKRGDETIAGALNFIGGDTLYGRNWGCTENVPFLHFETCYYQAMDFAMAHKLRVVEAGAQGDHKLARGYVPVKTQSFHHLAHPGLSRAVAQFLAQERAAIAEGQEALAAHAPFRHTEQE
ncbi:GNAT family N-acetyltransferase [Aestuariivirga litoralis]|uniref:GNAT family N-acetyltransferase n=1 Tax=Aestuariivirga litoralis TaxID=2650924 RepID=UPI0018C7488E|nr:GNAT family N-acetyltransferase [Aestuariivirga litoralis]MBG1231631.1 N-acetyltransferase [Aestuariivirga litoralis]